MSHRGSQPSNYSSGVITEEVREFLIEFQKNLHSRNIQSIRRSYFKFLSITENTFQVSTWPKTMDVIHELHLDIANDISDKIFALLYSELYFRHAFDRCDITYEMLHSSFQNYVNLFNILSQYLDNNQMEYFPELPNTWLWQMIHSFVSQFQYYHHWKNMPENNETLLKYANTQYQQIIQEKWSIKAVLRYLHFLVGAANIPLKYNAPPVLDAQTNENESKRSSTLYTLGYFSLVGLLRVHCMIGDYRAAISAISCVDLKRKSAITRIQIGYITTHYYLAFASMMLRRFADTHELCCTVLTRYEIDDERRNNRLKKSKLSNEDSDKEKYIKRYINNEALLDRTWAMLAIAQTQIPQKLDEQTLASPLAEEFQSEMDDIQNISGDLSSDDHQSYYILFEKACPDFLNVFDCFSQKSLIAKIAANENSLDESADHQSQDVQYLRNYQFRCFMRLTKKRNNVLKIKNELKLYKCIPVKQLANNMQFVTETDLHRSLIRLKCSMKQIQKSEGGSGGSNGGMSANEKCDDFDFFVDKKLVHVRELRASKLWKYSNIFVRNVRNLKELIENNNT